ncbi:hypothetical protein SM033_00002 [Vibrio phage vB_VpaM_sm033]|nr:hypothetical protein SM033_00002 [Vibrio phage vB_VpaM_sm033]
MKENFVIHLINASDSTPTGWVLITNEEYFNGEELQPFSIMASYEKSVLVNFEGKIYKSLFAMGPGDFNESAWVRVDRAYSEIPKVDSTLSYPEDALVLDILGNLKYSIFAVAPGDTSTWEDPTTGLEVASAFAYFEDELETKSRLVSGKMVKLASADDTALPDFVGELEDPEEAYKGDLTEKVVAYYDASQIATLSTTLAPGNVPAEDERVAFVRDISGNGNHAIQMDVRKRPVLKRDANGRFFLRFNPGNYMETKFPHTGEVSQFVNFAAAGVPRFVDTYDGKIRLGMKSEADERYWAWGGEAIVEAEQDILIRDEIRAKVVTDKDSYAPRTQFSGFNLFRDETTLVDHMSDFDTTGMKALPGFLEGCLNFNDDISGWDVTESTDFRRFFKNCPLFDGEISNWDTTKATRMDEMFQGATAFNSDISSWTVDNVTSFYCMFRFAESFDQPLNTWNTGLAESMSFMFEGALAFNQPLSNWDLSSCQFLMAFLRGATSFEQDLSTWCVSHIAIRPTDFMDEDEVNGDAFEPRWGEAC